MASHSTSHHINSGFTLTEVIISIGILSLIAALGLFISIDFYRNYSFRSERSTVVSILQKARSQSLDNIDEVRHGVHFASPLKYVLFECASSTPQCTDYAHADTSKDISIDPAYGSSVSGLPFDVVFNQLDGGLATATTKIVLTDQGTNRCVFLNTEGQIDQDNLALPCP